MKSVVIFALLLFSAHASGKQRQGHALYSVTLVTPNPDAVHTAGPRKIILHPRSARLSLAYKQFFPAPRPPVTTIVDELPPRCVLQDNNPLSLGHAC